MIEKAEAIVLKSRKYGETSKIITLYTKEYGKLSVIAKGSRSKNNRFGSSLELLSHISIVFYKYENRDLQYITQSSTINFFPAIRNNAEKIMYALPVIELINNVIQSDEQSEEFFYLIIKTLDSLNKAEGNFINFLIYFELQLACRFGFQPDFFSCEFCGAEINNEPNIFNVEKGCILCNDCSQKTVLPGIKLSLECVKYFQKFIEISPEDVSKITLSPGVSNSMFGLITRYLKNHISGMKDLKSLEIMGGII